MFFPFLRSKRSLAIGVVLLLLLLTLALGVATVGKSTRTGPQAAGPAIQQLGKSTQNGPQAAIHHFLYVLPEGGIMYVYDIDHHHALVKEISLPPAVRFIRGVGADPISHALYIAYGSVSGGGQLMKMDLLTNHVIYRKHMPVGIDSFDITPDGKRIYMPDGDGQSDGIWRVVDAATGDVTASIDSGGHNPHNTIVSLNGTHVYMGPRLSNYLVMADTATNQVIRRIGPLQEGVRPFTINSKETLAFIETSDFLGFDVAAIATGKILYTVPIAGKSTAGGFAPAHGISLSPDERELYVSDWPNAKLHVFDIAGLPGSAPQPIADIPVHTMVGNDTPCVATNCQKEGWLLHSLDGRFVYVGDAGDVIDTRTRHSVAYLQPLANTRKFIEIDWRNGLPIATSSRYGKGYAGVASPSPQTLNPRPTKPGSAEGMQQYLYAFYQNTVTLYDMDRDQRHTQTIALPSSVHAIRGVAADVASRALYIAFGSNSSNGSLLKYDLVTDQVIYAKTYPTGVDSFALTKDGKKIYMPDGDGQADTLWHIIDTATGNVIGEVAGGSCPHNTVTGPSGKYIYLAGRCTPYVFVVDPTTNQVVKRIGPFRNGGIRPFTVNGSETLVFVTDNAFIGFEVGDVATGKVLYSVPATGWGCHCANYDAPSHGISLSPDEKEVYIPDRFNQYVHVFDVSRLPVQPPTHSADIPLAHPISGDVPPPCSLDCMREGWVLHSRDGRFVYVGDSGDVIDTSLRKVVAYVPGLNASRIYCEIDWQHGTPVATTNRYGEGV